MKNPSEATTNGGIYNRAGIGYPDVLNTYDSVVIFLDGMPILIGGTSALAALFSAMLNSAHEEVNYRLVKVQLDLSIILRWVTSYSPISSSSNQANLTHHYPHP